MILVHGRDELVGQLVRHFTDARREAAAVARDDDVFELVVARRPSAVIGVTDPGGGHDAAQAIVDDLIRTSHAPKPPVVVLVSDLPADAPAIHKLKRSGAAYVLIARPAARRVATTCETVWLSHRVATEQSGTSTTADLLDTVADALRDDAPVGVARAPRSASWRTALAVQQRKIREVPNWTARLAASLGRPAVYRRGDEVIARLEPTPNPWWRQTLRLPSST